LLTRVEQLSGKINKSDRNKIVPPFLAFETINNFKTEILMAHTDDDISDNSESLMERRHETLVSILNTASPLHGQGFFNVNHSIATSLVGAATTYIVALVQFNMSEKPLEE
jgi:hypothetical protein